MEKKPDLVACENVDLTLSYHTVAGKTRCPEDFTEKLYLLPRDKIGRVSVSVMYEDETSAESARAFKLAHQVFVDLGGDMERLDVSTLLSSKLRNVSYSSEQLAEFEALHSSLPEKEHELYQAALADGSFANLSEDELFEQLGDDYFYHQLCSASQRSFYVAADGLVYDCPMCHSYAPDSSKYVVGSVYSDKPPKRRQIVCPFRYYCNMPETPKKKVFRT